MVLTAFLFSAGAAASVFGYRYFSQKEAAIRKQVFDIPTIDAHSEDILQNVPHDKQVILSHKTGIEIPWYSLFRQQYVPVIRRQTGVSMSNGQLKPIDVYTTQNEMQFIHVGSCLNMSVYSKLPLEPSKDVSYVPSLFDIKLTTPRSGADISAMIPLRRPRTHINYRSLYNLVQYSGKIDSPLFYLGRKNDDIFIFDRFGRDSMAIKNEEAYMQSEGYYVGKITAALAAVGCVVGVVVACVSDLK